MDFEMFVDIVGVMVICAGGVGIMAFVVFWALEKIVKASRLSSEVLQVYIVRIDRKRKSKSKEV